MYFVVKTTVCRSLSNLKEKYTTTFRHKRIHNCITQSKASRRTMAVNAGNVPQLWAIITSHTVRTFKVMHCTRHAACNNFEFTINLMNVGFLTTQYFSRLFKMSRPTDFQNLQKHFHVLQFIKSPRGAHFYTSFPGVAARIPALTPLPDASVTPLPDVSCTLHCRAPVHHHNNPSVHYQAQYNVMSDYICKLCVVEVRDAVLLCLFCRNIYFCVHQYQLVLICLLVRA